MSFSRYSKYKDSNVGWFKLVPSHWRIEPCRSVFLERNERNDPLVNEDYLSLMANVGVMPYEEKGDVGNKKPEDLGKCKQVYKGDLVINSMNYGIGSFGLSKYRGVCSPVYIVLTPHKDKIEERFAFRILEAKQFQKYAQSFGNGILEHRAAINWDILKVIGIPTPPIEEQRHILNFLDDQTSRIDSLISEQEKLIELLKEKRQAVISHTVTKGLVPHVKMKDSGVEWLGEVPEHWEVKKGAYIGRLFGSEQIAEDDVSDVGPVPFLKVSSLSEHSFEIQSWDWFITEEAAQGAHTRNNYIVFPKRGAAIFLNKVNIVRQPSVIDPNLMGWQMYEFAELEYIAYALKARKLDELADVSTVPQINNKHINPEKFPLPPLSEQLEIVKFLKTSIRRIDILITESVLSIALLQERRSALICAAVTGEIDTRKIATQMEAA